MIAHGVRSHVRSRGVPHCIRPGHTARRHSVWRRLGSSPRAISSLSWISAPFFPLGLAVSRSRLTVAAPAARLPAHHTTPLPHLARVHLLTGAHPQPTPHPPRHNTADHRTQPAPDHDPLTRSWPRGHLLTVLGVTAVAKTGTVQGEEERHTLTG